MSIIIPINTVKVYCDSILALYMKGSVFKAVVAISIVSTVISEWVKALLASSMLVEVILSSVKSLKVVK